MILSHWTVKNLFLFRFEESLKIKHHTELFESKFLIHWIDGICFDIFRFILFFSWEEVLSGFENATLKWLFSPNWWLSKFTIAIMASSTLRNSTRAIFSSSSKNLKPSTGISLFLKTARMSIVAGILERHNVDEGG